MRFSSSVNVLIQGCVWVLAFVKSLSFRRESWWGQPTIQLLVSHFSHEGFIVALLVCGETRSIAPSITTDSL